MCYEIKSTMMKLFDPVVVSKLTRRVPPRCIAGRWGTIYETEKFLTAAFTFDSEGK